MAAEVLIKKGKRGAAAYLQSECANSSNHKVLNELLDILLDPNKPLDWDTIDWCRWLVAGGRTPDEFTQTVRRYDNATTCGLVWTANFVAYRCRTCGISPCMSLCAECFQRGNHEGHDFNMFRSQAGGACDCGDTSVMKETGFCQRHGPKSQEGKPAAPPDLLCVAEAMMPRIIVRLIHHLRDHSIPALLDRYLSAVKDADGFLTMLHQMSEMGAVMRRVMTTALTNPAIYQMLAVECDHPNPQRAAFLKKSYQMYEDAKRELTNWDRAIYFLECIKALELDLKHTTFLEELVFWTVRFEFPQKLVCFLLNMLPDLDYKEAITRTFVHHYSRISVMLSQSQDSETLSSRVVHVSVQLFSNEQLALSMTKNFHLLHVMIISLKAMMSCILLQNTLQGSEKNDHYVVNCGHRILKEHCYWPLVSDLNNVLTHRPVALEFLKDTEILDMWFSFLYMFQGMNVSQRELEQHVEFEPNTYYAAFSAELEASATPMWALISHLKDEETLHLTKQVLTQCVSALREWFEAIGFTIVDRPSSYQISFHLPLHRYFAAFLCQAVRHQKGSLPDLLPSSEMLQLLMMHPLQAQVAFHEILSGMWVRNGLQIKGQAMTYIQCHFCNSMVDADLFLLQLCATFLDPDWFLKTVLQRFHVWDWLSFHPAKANTFLDNDQTMHMLEGALTFITMLIAIRTNIGHSEEDVTRQEMVSLLCMSDRTHSQLMDLLPEKCGITFQNREFETILAKVADYKAPNFEAGGTMLQGIYVPKPEIWENEFDPIHVLLRAVHRRDYQASLDRFTQFIRQTRQFTGSGSPWPPFRIPGIVHEEFKDCCKILHSRTMHAMLFIILYRACHDSSIPDQVVALAVYLLDMAVRFSLQTCYDKDIYSSKEEVPDLNFTDWFSSESVFQNVLATIKKIVIFDQEEVYVRTVEEIEVDIEEEEMDTSLECATYHVQSPVAEEENPDVNAQHPSLPAANVPLALPSSSGNIQFAPLVPITGSLAVTQILSISGPSSTAALPSTMNNTHSLPGPNGAQPMPIANVVNLTIPPSETLSLPLNSEDNRENMAVVPTTRSLTTRPHCLRLKRVPGRHNLLTGRNVPLLLGSEPVKALPSASWAAIDINESIVSLLIKLHSKFTDKPDSYKTKSETSKSDKEYDVLSGVDNSRIGDGPYFIGNLLDRICQLNRVDSEAHIREVRQRLWPKVLNEPVKESTKESLDKEERRRRAKERQQKLMAEFASRQKAFMQQTMESDQVNEMSGKEEDDSILNIVKEYECVICGQTTPSTEERPFGLVVLLQASSVLGHCHQDPVINCKLPCSDEEKLQLRRELTRAAHMKHRIKHLTENFNSISWQRAINIGWEGGVHVQSCGHFLHLDCHRSYIQSLKSRNQQSQRHQSFTLGQNEFSCPLCRQLANSVLPVTPDMGEMTAVVRCHPSNLQAIAQELSQLLSTSIMPVSDFWNVMSTIMDDLTNITYPIYRSVSSPDHHSLFLFICSIARTNLELEIVQRGGTLGTPLQKKSCFARLFHVLSLHLRVLKQPPYSQLWSQLTGLSLDDHLSSLTLLENEVPLLLRDCSALLIQLILTLPLNVDKAYYSCVIKVLCNLACVQAVAQLSCLLPQNERLMWKQAAMQNQEGLGAILGQVIDHLEHSNLYLDDDDLDASLRAKHWTVCDLELYAQNLCLPFLRIAALLQCHLYDEESPHIKNLTEELPILCKYLGLSSVVECSITSCLNWATDKPEVLIRTWCQDYINFVNKSLIAARSLLERPVKWHQPSLLQLPANYDQIFQYYYRRPCSTCHKVPKDPSLCLICGVMVCLRENCCRQTEHNRFEAVAHSISCGAGTAVFLAVNSSTIIVIRGQRACLWGSVYLDNFGEEDRDLKRGKPLYLSKERYTLLQQQWLNHSFDHTNKRWVWHKDNL